MSKTILQEIATFNAQEQNTGALKAEIATYQNDVTDYFITSKEIIADNISTYKIIAEGIKNSLQNDTDEITIAIDKNKLQIAALEEFAITEISTNYQALGIIRQEYRRRDVQLDNKIDQLTLEKLEHFTGPIASILTDSEGNFTGYGAKNLESARDWMYIMERALKYKGQFLLELQPGLTQINIGDSIYNRVYMPGTLDVAKNLSVFGKIFVNSPSTETESITVNKSIHTTDGEVIATFGLSTTNGDIKTGTGNISTVTGNITTGLGDIKTSDGDFISLKGGVEVTTGFLTTAGNIVTNNGSLIVTSGMTSTGTGDITVNTGSLIITEGNIWTKDGYIRTDLGNITTGRGDIGTTRGNFFTDDGDFTTKDGNFATLLGNISTQEGDIYTKDGRLWVGGTTATWTPGVTEMLMKGGNLTISGNFKADGTLNVASLTTGQINATDLKLSGSITQTGAGLNDFAGSINTAKALSASTLQSALGTIVGTSLTVGTTLSVSGSSTFTGDINATGRTITAAIFDGLATKANYADVAEKYLCNQILTPGTVVSLSTNDNYEIEIYNENLPLAGVISTLPGFMLNDNSNTKDDHWLFVALTGRIPVLVSGNVKKGMYLVPDKENPGFAVGLPKNELDSINCLNLIGVAISNSKDGYVEAKVK